MNLFSRRGRRAVGVLVAGGSLLAAAMAPLGAQSRVNAAFEAFWAADSGDARAAAAAQVVASGVSLGEAYKRLKAGRTYRAQVPRGPVARVRDSSDGPFPYVVDVPSTYTPDRRYQVRIQLHGGVGRPDATRRNSNGIGALAGAEQIYVLPTAWRDQPWWSPGQRESLRVILDEVKTAYNVDENRVVLSGVSDGGTGAYYVAMRDTTPFASFLPLNGFLMILANPSLALNDGLYPHNLTNKPFFVVNGGRDPLYPTSMVDPYVEHLQRGGVSLVYRPQPEAGHNTAWWPVVRDEFEAFVRDHPRDPHPPAVTWETDGAPGTTRAHWVVIEELGPPAAAAPLPDLNDRVVGQAPNFGVRTSGMRVQAVLPGSNAAAMGFEPGDLVASVNGRPLPDGLDLLEYLGIFSAGERLTFQIVRADTSNTATRTVELSGDYRPTSLPRTAPLFARTRPSGRVDVVRSGNHITATTRGVQSFSVLLSPDAFDLAAPITVTVDGRPAFNGRITQDLATLMKWAARDNDRTMLYLAELRIDR